MPYAYLDSNLDSGRFELQLPDESNSERPFMLAHLRATVCSPAHISPNWHGRFRAHSKKPDPKQRIDLQ